MKKILLPILACLFLTNCESATMVDNTPIASIDLNRYLGTWYEIARYDHRFERGMEHTMANYSLRQDGMIAVKNTGIKDGEFKVSEGKAKTTDIPALLRVSFFGPFYGDYRILLLGENYEYSLVGGGSDDYLWILSRTPEVDGTILNKILDEAIKRGYDTSRLIWVNHE
jgi:lipocalin